jgi:hypothetical protein
MNKRMPRAGVVVLFALAFSAGGCGGYLGSAQRAYEEGRYLEAAEKLGEHEAEVESLPPPRQADYGLYRGLSLIMLGDYEGAGPWLRLAASLEQQRPGTLRPAQRRELADGLEQLSRPSPSPPQKAEPASSGDSALATPAPARWER